MEILKSGYVNFRNLENNTIEYGNKINFIYGANAQGKTSVLESIYFTITGKSFRTSTIKDIAKYGNELFGSFLNYSDSFGEKELSVRYNNGKKEYFYNNKKIDYDNFIGKIAVVTFTPEDIEIINGTPSIRRSFFDYEISQSNHEYYLNLKEFCKVLKARNMLLKKGISKGELFEIYTEKYLELGTKLIIKRNNFAKNLSILLNLNYRKLFEGNSELLLFYSTFIGELNKNNYKEIYEVFSKKIKDSNKKESFYGYTLEGPQKDDFIFLLKGKNAKYFSSQGEKKSIIFSLKIAESEIIFKEKKEYPVFLIDDISSYFDLIRKEKLFDFFKKRKIQTFITSTDKAEIESKFLKLESGKVIHLL